MTSASLSKKSFLTDLGARLALRLISHFFALEDRTNAVYLIIVLVAVIVKFHIVVKFLPFVVRFDLHTAYLVSGKPCVLQCDL